MKIFQELSKANIVLSKLSDQLESLVKNIIPKINIYEIYWDDYDCSLSIDFFKFIDVEDIINHDQENDIYKLGFDKIHIYCRSDNGIVKYNRTYCKK